MCSGSNKRFCRYVNEKLNVQQGINVLKDANIGTVVDDFVKCDMLADLLTCLQERGWISARIPA